MKFRFSTLDVVALLPELNERCCGLRVANVYNVNNKTYLIKLSKGAGDAKEEDEDTNKNVLLIESGSRFHLTEFDWPKEPTPNGFSMKLRKHLKNKRIESIRQFGLDRIIDIQFGIRDAAYHIIVELYNRGNILITDHNYIILSLLRPRKDGENDDVVFRVKERYPVEQFQQVPSGLLEKSEIRTTLDEAKVGDNLRKLFTPKFKIYGPALLEHCFIECGLGENCKVDANRSVDVDKIYRSFEMATSIMANIGQQRGGWILQKEEPNVLQPNDENGQPKKIITFLEFNPMLFSMYKTPKSDQSIVHMDSFNNAVDTFFSSIEAQKLDQRIYQKERDAMKKLDNIKRDHEKRLLDLEEQQKVDNRRGYLIEINNDLVEKALFILRSALARQMSWSDIRHMLKEAKEAGDEVALKICSLKFETNRFTMILEDPYDQAAAAAAAVDANADADANAETASAKQSKKKPPAKPAKDQLKPGQLKVDISLELSAYANARKYFEERKVAQKKENKTIEASGKALKSAQIKTAQALKEVQLKSSIIKSRKVLWFEKFHWFISSENYIVIAGRDSQQNEMIVKRYLRPGDLYVHADLHGASSVVIKNRSSKERIPAKTIEEAGCFSVCHSSAWASKVPVRAWWVNAEQVSKTAPSGEFLTVGSFMIRGKKNYLPVVPMALGFCFFFKLNEESVANHVNDRKVKYVESGETAVEEQAIGEEENDEEELAFPDTKIRTSKSDRHEPDMILEAMKPRAKVNRKLKKPEKKAEQPAEPANKPTPATKANAKNKRGKGKSKKGKKDDWSDDEDKIAIKLERKLQKDSRLMDLESQMKVVSLNDYLNDDEVEDADRTANGELNAEVNDQAGEATNAETNEKSNEKSNENTKEESTDQTSQQNDLQTAEGEIVESSQPTNEESSDDEVPAPDEESEEELEEEETNEERKEAEYLKLVNTLTGQPLPEDVLMYCMPVVAPYNAVQNCKFKVKVLPGPGKRGKSAKTALHLFLTDRKITSRERDLLKSMKDQEIARNLPSQIKITAQHLQQVKRKK